MVIDEKIKTALISEFFTNTGATYNSVVNLFTLGIDHQWKKKIVGHLTAPKRVLDLACGTGILSFMIAQKFPKSQVVAVDVSPGYLEVAWRNAYKKNIKNVSFVLNAAENFTSTERFDVVTASYLAKYAHLDRLIPNLAKMIVSGGTLLFHDFTYPKSKSLQRLFWVYFKIIQVIGGLIYPEWKSVLVKLPDLIRDTAWVSELTKILAKEGFDQIKVESLTLEGSALVSARKK